MISPSKNHPTPPGGVRRAQPADRRPGATPAPPPGGRPARDTRRPPPARDPLFEALRAELGL